MKSYTFTDDSGNYERFDFDSDEAAVAAARDWAEAGEYEGEQEIAVWRWGEWLVTSFKHVPLTPCDCDDGQPDEAQEWADFDPDC